MRSPSTSRHRDAPAGSRRHSPTPRITLGRPVAGRQADPVARLLLPRLRAGQRRARHEHVLVSRRRAQRAVDRDAGARHRLLVEVLRPEPLARPGTPRHGQTERDLARLPARVELEPAGREAAGRQHDPVARGASTSRRPTRARSAVDARVAALGADDHGVEDHPAAGPPQPLAQRGGDAHARHRRRQRRHLEHRPRRAAPAARSRRCARRRCPSTAGNATRSSAPQPRTPPGRRPRRGTPASSNARAKPSELTSARPSGTRSSSTARAAMPARAQVVGEQRRVEVLERPEADHAHLAAAAQVARRPSSPAPPRSASARRPPSAAAGSPPGLRRTGTSRPSRRGTSRARRPRRRGRPRAYGMSEPSSRASASPGRSTRSGA